MKTYIALLCLFLAGCVITPEVIVPKTNGTCQIIGGYLPDPNCTPGSIMSNATLEVICTTGYSSTVRDVSNKLKEQVYQNYGIYNRTPYQYQIDHLVSLQLGGSNSIDNLWPMETKFKKKNKDPVENCLRRKVCSGEMSLEDAQKGIANNWTRYVGVC
jgi:hypothetical protein